MENQDLNNYEKRYIHAKERVKQLRDFYGHAAWYVIIITGLAILNYYTNDWRYPWFLWAAGGWGIGLFSHALGTFNVMPFMNRSWEERKIKEIMEQEKKMENNITNTRWE